MAFMEGANIPEMLVIDFSFPPDKPKNRVVAPK